ncbi:hypothetical protein BDP27DRAFT_1144976, partial [Rhodocollybia butyracea]
IWLLDHEYGIEDVAYLLGVTERSVYRWLENKDTHGSVVAPDNHARGRPPILSTEMVHDLISLAEEAPEMYVEEIRDWLAVA